ncbi:MAG TPA: phosphatidate cytidylyltransferase [Anaerolineales bacterium]|nr:phosphatidate cytidylyltransferase [Anaerolineales bacterium]
MLAQRLLVIIVLLPLGMLVIHLGGWAYALVVALLMGLAAREYGGLFRAAGLQPASALIVIGTLLLVLGRALDDFNSAPAATVMIILVSMTYHLLRYEGGRDQAGTDLSVTLSGILYVGWLGGYLISVRRLPDGEWWTLLVLPAVWLADGGAFFIGSSYGRHKLSARLSPMKSWEGYLGGVAVGTLSTTLLAALWRIGAGPQSAITPGAGALLGFILAAASPLGDLGESMLKRQVGKKDSSNLLPGHGGIFDRVDSWLWAAPIGYYCIVWFLM